ncbi:MAG: RsmE family RNA methyltransferase [Ktedonobacteraceae bacterium]
MHRFFVGELALRGVAPGATLALPDSVAHQVRTVLRIAIDEQLILFDNSGDELVAIVVSSARSGVDVQIVERRAGAEEPAVRIILCQGLLKSARFEWILEKGTELGVSTFAPILCRRSMAGLEEAGPAKIQRWQRIIQEASEQCGRARVPDLLPIRPLIHALNDIPAGALALMPWEEEKAQTLSLALRSARTQAGPATTAPGTVVLFIGPEGGLMAEEVALAQRHGVGSVTLGRRILRAETAALATVANVVYELEL